jgi:hypothetical protein
VMLSTYGKGGIFLFFLGYETDKEARTIVTDGGVDAMGNPIITTEEHALAGRLTFVYNF